MKIESMKCKRIIVSIEKAKGYFDHINKMEFNSISEFSLVFALFVSSQAQNDNVKYNCSKEIRIQMMQ